MIQRLTSKFFINNRRKLLSQVDSSQPIVITGNGLIQSGGDSTFPFHQDASFYYLSGVNHPDVILVINDGQEFLILPSQDEAVISFDGEVDHNEIQKTSGVRQVYDCKNGWDNLTKIIKKSLKVQSIQPLPEYIDLHGFYANPARRFLITKLKSINSNLSIIDIGKNIASLRVIKQSEELGLIQLAIDITIDTISEVVTKSKSGQYSYENEIEADISAGFRKRGADGHAFSPIVAGGSRACQIHNITNNQKLKAGELIVLDIGAEVDHYVADISRTISLSKSPSKRLLDVFEAVVDVQKYAFSLIKPGFIFRDYEIQVRKYMANKLRQLGLKINGKNDVNKIFPHATSHYVGLETHDSGDYSAAFDVGMVLAVEPGIYLADEGIGIRIEDNVLITKQGIKVLSERLPTKLY